MAVSSSVVSTVDIDFTTKIFGIRTVTDRTNEQVLISQTVPEGKRWKLRTAKLFCRINGRFFIEADSVIIGSGGTGPSAVNVDFSFTPAPEYEESKAIELKFTAAGPIGLIDTDVDAYLMFEERDI